MNYKEIKKDIMCNRYAKEISKWNYNDEYSIYNLPSYEEMKDKKYGMTQEKNCKNYICYILDNEVIAYVNMKELDDNILYIGIGLKPSYCGKGNGNYFLLDSLNEINNRYPNYKKYIEVRSWNKRAIKLYEKVGFKVTNIITKKDRFGNMCEFTEMTL